MGLPVKKGSYFPSHISFCHFLLSNTQTSSFMYCKVPSEKNKIKNQGQQQAYWQQDIPHACPLAQKGSHTTRSAPLKPHAVRSYYCKEKCRRRKNIHCCVQGAKWAQQEFSPAKFNLCLVSRRVNRMNTETLKIKTFTALSLNYIP